MIDGDRCLICGGELAITATLIGCKACRAAWGRCNGRWIEDLSECTAKAKEPRWNPRYLAYCAARGHAGDPEGMLLEDEVAWPGGKMTGFMLWISERWQSYDQAHGLGRDPMRDEVMLRDFERWIGCPQ